MKNVMMGLAAASGMMLISPAIATEKSHTPAPECEALKDGKMKCCKKAADGKAVCEIKDHSKMKQNEMKHDQMKHDKMDHGSH
tara:strand:+ start:390 stop:638 length:249 start_codon:yes stop_codon:yes gene_type:complete